MKAWHVILALVIVGGVGWFAWKRYKDALALKMVMQDPKGVAKLGIDHLVDAKVNQGLNMGIDLIASKIGL
jgi:hypothetical protein